MASNGSESPSKAKRSRADMEADDRTLVKESAAHMDNGKLRKHQIRA